MYYGKFENNSFIFSPKKIRVGDAIVFNPTGEIVKNERFDTQYEGE